MITEKEWKEYLKIKRQLDLVKKVENQILSESYEIETKEGYDPEFIDVEREIIIDGDVIKIKVFADCGNYEFKFLKEKIVESNS